MISLVRLKSIMFCLTLFLLLFFKSLIAVASTDESQSALDKFEANVVEARLSNGIKVLLYRRGVAPVFGGVVMVGVGGVDEVPGQTGISHMLEHMAFKGTQKIGTKDYPREKKLLEDLEEIVRNSNSGRDLNEQQKKKWEKIQAELGKLWEPGQFDRLYKQQGQVGLNATTGKELTTFFVNFPRSAFEFWAQTESERILQPVMRQFYRERDVVMEERRMRFEDDPNGKIYERLLGVSYLEHPYRNPVIGYEQDLQSLTAKQTLNFQRSFYLANNIVVAVVGDVNPEQDIEILERTFGRIPKGELPPRPNLIETKQEGEREITLKLPVSPQALIAYKKPNFPDPDDAPLSLMEEVLAGSRISPLYRRLVQEKQVATSVSIFEAPGNRYPNLLIFSLVPRKPATNKMVLKEFDATLKELLRQPPSEEQVQIARRSIAMSFLTGLDSNISVAQDLASSELTYGDWRAMLKWFDQILKVTPEDVHRVAKKYLDRDKRTIANLEKKEGE